MPFGTGVPARGTGRAMPRSPERRCGRFFESLTVERRTAWRGMRKESVRHTCEHLATAEEGCLRCVRYVKGQHTTRINDILCVE